VIARTLLSRAFRGYSTRCGAIENCPAISASPLNHLAPKPQRRAQGIAQRIENPSGDRGDSDHPRCWGRSFRLSRQTTHLKTALARGRTQSSQLETICCGRRLTRVMVLSCRMARSSISTAPPKEVFSISRDHGAGASYIETAGSRPNAQRPARQHRRISTPRANATGRNRPSRTSGRRRVGFSVELSVFLWHGRTMRTGYFVTYIRDITDKLQKSRKFIRAATKALDAYQKIPFFRDDEPRERHAADGILSAIHLLHDEPAGRRSSALRGGRA